MVIKHNIPAMNSHRNTAINNKNTSVNLEKLSSGFRVNRAADDAAGLAISEKMRGQIRGLAMAETNTEHGISLIKTAEGGLNETHSILHRMRELAVQSSNGTYQDEDRKQIALEVEALKSEIDRISGSTHYNGIRLLDGTLGASKVSDLKGDPDNGINDGSLTALGNHFKDFGFNISISGDTVGCDLKLESLNSAFDNQVASLIVTSGVETGGKPQLALQVGDITYTGKQIDLAASETFTTADGNQITLAASDMPFYFFDNDGNVVASIELLMPGSEYLFQDPLPSDSQSGVISNIAMGLSSSAPMNLLSNGDTGSDSIPKAHPMYDSLFANDNSKLVFQIGANGGEDQRVGLHVRNMSSANLGDRVTTATNDTGTVRDAVTLTREAANEAIDVIDLAINQVSAQRAQLGALQNRLEHTLNNLGVTKENITASESTIRDVDMAKEMMEFTKNQILVQASQAMLAQANQLPQGVLSLLR